jgi:hypothetical protein
MVRPKANTVAVFDRKGQTQTQNQKLKEVSIILDMCDGVVPSIPDLLPEGYSPPVIKVLHTYIVAIPGLAAIADEIYN